MRGNRALDLLKGLAVCTLGAVALALAPGVGARGAEPGTGAPATATHAEPVPNPLLGGQTLLGSEPPDHVGEAFDSDASLPAHAKPVASYTLSARLDAERHTVDGHGTIVFENVSARPLSELFVHAYLNAFKNSRTLFLRSPFAAGRSGRGAEHWGYLDVTRFSVRELSRENLWPARGSKTGEDPDDETDVRVPLPRPIAPGETVSIDLEWTSQLPEIVERTGYEKDFHLVGQWFPKLAKLSPDGTFVHFPFHAQSEFFADYGSYDVSLDVPAAHVVGATGVLVEEKVEGGRRKVRYHADDVHDFAWTSWPDFLERRATVDGVAVRILYPPGNETNADANLRAVTHGLRFFGRAYGRYPYPVLTVVHPPSYAEAATGMEYPTFITTGFPWWVGIVSSFTERVAIHELGHQWFYGLVGTDEHAFPFLDEGLTTFAESSAMEALLGPGNGFRAPGLDVDGRAHLRGLAASAGHDDVVARPAPEFSSFHEIGALVYARTDTILATVARVYGAPLLDRALGRYARRYRFEHPGPKHLVAVVREVMGDEPADFLARALFEGGTVDFVADSVTSLRARAKAGVFDGPSGRTTEPAPAKEPDRYIGRVLVYRHGTLRVPVDVELRFEDGSRERRRWDGMERFRSFECEGPSRLVAAVVDPDLAVLLDDDLSNNAVRSGPGSTARLVERALYASELALGSLGP
ncbi:MAG TPA: M1 family metallopeptidase [Polyangiaceae bacterium]|nr:M1 family metallopeptidase [Polyangiaceae bacterium]